MIGRGCQRCVYLAEPIQVCRSSRQEEWVSDTSFGTTCLSSSSQVICITLGGVYVRFVSQHFLKSGLIIYYNNSFLRTVFWYCCSQSDGYLTMPYMEAIEHLSPFLPNSVIKVVPNIKHWACGMRIDPTLCVGSLNFILAFDRNLGLSLNETVRPI